MIQDDVSSSLTSSSPLQFFSTMSPNSSSFLQTLKPEERGLYLIHLLLTCATHVSHGSLAAANSALDQISRLATPGGDTVQRIASYFAEALADRILRSCMPGMYRALHFTKTPPISDEILAGKLFFDLFPFLRLSSLITNQSIMEAMQGEKIVHVVDLNAGEPAQWTALFQAMSARSEGPPHLRITAVHKHKEVLDRIGHRLTHEAEKLDLPFQFNPVLVTELETLEMAKLKVKTGEALAITSVLHLHTLLSSGDDLGGFLGGLRRLSPKIFFLTEQDSAHNGGGLMERLSESLFFYAALFDCLESAVPRSSEERRRVERTRLGEEIKNIVACEGRERRERHEKAEKWARRMEMAGFEVGSLSYGGLVHAKELVQSFNGGGSHGYGVRENGCGGVVMCWQERPLFSVSAWRCRR